MYELSCFLVLKNVYYTTVGINEILAPTGTGIYYIRVLWPSQSSLKFFLYFNTYFNTNVKISICFNKSVSCLSITGAVKFVIYCTTHCYWL